MRVTFYTRKDCHLCDDALAVVESVRAAHAFELVLVDIDTDEEARAKYWDKIPVVEVDGRIHAKYRVDADAFVRRLEAASRGTASPFGRKVGQAP